MPEGSPEGIAVIGMACIFPGAPNLRTYWSNIEAGVDAIREVPESRWERVFYDPTSSATDRLYCRRGGFIDAYASFDSLRFGVMPVAAHGSEPDQLLSLQVAASALADAGYEDNAFPNDRTGVILGRGNYIGAGMTRLEQHVRTAQQLVNALNELVPHLDDETLQAVKTQFQDKLGAYGPDTAIGLVPNLTASRISNRLDLKGPSYTVDGACASSLLAIDHAVRELRSKRCDLVLAGGVHLSHDVAFWSVFCQLGALSRSEQIRPFDQHADGLLIGEGLGVVVLKRVADAEHDGDRIYSVIRGVGVSSDGRESSLMVPRIDGQVMALKTAWEDAGLDPQSVGLIEAHGTATPVGDSAELSTLKRVFGPAQNGTRAGLGSVKSMIGHTMPAAGIAGFIKASLAVHHGILPPTLHCNNPHALLDETRFRILAEKEAWTEPVRRAGVNAFGFGGINAHVVLESHGEITRAAAVVPSFAEPGTPSVETWTAESPTELLNVLEGVTESHKAGRCRLAIHDPNEERLAKARIMISKGRRSTGRNGIWYEPDAPLCGEGRLAFLYPGVEAVFQPNVDDLIDAMGMPALPEVQAGDLESQGFALIQLERMLTDVLMDDGIVPDVLAGHSIGEWTGMITSGMIPQDAVSDFIQSLVPGSLNVPGVSFLAVGCGADRAQASIEGLSDIAISHDNCPHQVILCGTEAQIAQARERLEMDRVLCQELPFRSGFHSPLFADYVSPHQEHFESLPIQPPSIPLWSATTGRAYGDDVLSIRKLAVDHLIRPVQFRRVIEDLYNEGVRVFVQVGPGSLTGFVNDILRGQPHLAVSAVDDRRPALQQLLRVRTALFVSGLDLALDDPEYLAREANQDTGIHLALGVPLVRLDKPLDVGLPFDGLAMGLDATDPVLSEFQGVLRDVAGASAAVVEAYAAEKSQESAVEDVSIRRHLSVETCPDLLDHCFFRQPEGWECVTDRFPVVPLTMLVEMMKAAGQDLAPERFVVSMEHLRAYKWLAVAPGVDTVTRASWLDADRIKVAIEGYAECVLRLADGPLEAPKPEAWQSEGDDTFTLAGDRLYDEHWMFHGPAYQGVSSVDAVTQQGIRGVLRNVPAEGALLDNAGQLFGYWVMVKTEVDRLAMPVMVERITWYGDELPANAAVPCSVFVRKLGDRQVRADMELLHEGRLWARVEGWTDQRFDTNARSWPVIRHPETHMLSVLTTHGFVFLEDGFATPASQDYFHRRYLSEAERSVYQDRTEVRKPSWLAGRIAAKDAIRYWLRDRGLEAVFPVEVQITNDESGRPQVVGLDEHDLRISLAHKDRSAVAMVVSGRAIGVDMERVEERSERFVNNALTAAEQSLLPGGDRSEWVTRFWCAKEAAGKARGTGLSGSPRKVPISAVDEERICADGTWVQTTRMGQYVVGWTIET